MSTTVGRLAATAGVATMIVAAASSIMKMYEVVGRTPFTTSDLLPAVAVLLLPSAGLLVGLLVWWRHARAGWAMIVFATLGWLAIMNVGISTTADGITLSSSDPTTQVLATLGALLVGVGLAASRRRSAARSSHQPAIG